jgi:hypothetical protein
MYTIVHIFSDCSSWQSHVTTILVQSEECYKTYYLKYFEWGLLDIPTGQQTYKRDTKAHRHFSNFYAKQETCV